MRLEASADTEVGRYKPGPRGPRPFMSSSSNRLSVRLLLGLAVTGLGVVLMFDAADLFDADRVLQFWPVILLAMGLLLLSRARQGGPWFPGALLLLLGTALLLEELGYLRRGFASIWPLIIILAGLAIISRGLRTRGAQGDTASQDSISRFAVLGSSTSRVTSQAFRGGDITAFMGGSELDLTAADLGPDEAVVDIFVLMGGVEITVPSDWTVEARVMPFMGGMEDSTDRSTADPAKRLVIKGFVLMGGIEIKS